MNWSSIFERIVKQSGYTGEEYETTEMYRRIVVFLTDEELLWCLSVDGGSGGTWTKDMLEALKSEFTDRILVGTLNEDGVDKAKASYDSYINDLNRLDE